MANPIRLAFDSLVNVYTRMGTGADTTTATQFQLRLGALSDDQLEAAYRGDWLSRKIINVPADDATREWRDWQAEGDDIEAIETEEKRLGLRQKVRRAKQLGRLYGGAAIVIGANNGGGSSTPLDPEAVSEGGLNFVHVLPRTQITAHELIRDPTDPLFGQPKMYQINSAETGPVDIHPSRVIRFLGNQLPDDLRGVAPGGNGWGDSILLAVEQAIKDMGTSSAGSASLIQEAKVDVIRIPELSNRISADAYQKALSSRFAYAAQAKSLYGFLIMDKEEEWQRINQDFSQLPEMMRTFMLLVAGAADIPATRLFGQSAVGLNATGEGDLKNYYDAVTSEQKNELGPMMEPLDEMLIRSALGKRDPSIYFEWAPLYTLDEVQKATVFLTKMNAIEKLASNALVPEQPLAEAVQNMLVEDNVLPGIEDALVAYEEATGLSSTEIEKPPQIDPLTGLPIDPMTGAPVEQSGGNVVPIRQAPTSVPGRRTAPLATDGRSPLKRLRTARHRREAATRDGLFVGDSRPRSLYVRRDMQNADAVIAWAKAQGFKTAVTPDQMHVTIAFSRAPVNWMKIRQDYSSEKNGGMVIPPGGPRQIEKLGRATTLLFVSTWLSWRHESIRQAGASWDFEEYQPHVTITWQEDTPRLEDIEPYRGEIVLGPEIFEEVQEDWSSRVTEDHGWRP